MGGETRVDVMLCPRRPWNNPSTSRPDAPVLQRDSSALAEVVDTRQVEELPLNGRDFRKLAFLAPGAAPRSSARLARILYGEWPARKVEHLSDRWRG